MPASHPLCLASHPEAPEEPGDFPGPWAHLLAAGRDGSPSPNCACQGPEVPLALFLGRRKRLGVCFGFYVYLIGVFFRFLQMLPGTTVHLRKVLPLNELFWLGAHGTFQRRGGG